MSGKTIKVCVLVLTLMFVSGLLTDEAQWPSNCPQTWSSNVGQQIPDGPSGGGSGTALLNTIDVPLGSIVEGVEVYLNISMANWTSDLIVRLTSPAGTQLGLAWIGEGGIPETNIIGWFPIDFTPTMTWISGSVSIPRAPGFWTAGTTPMGRSALSIHGNCG